MSILLAAVLTVGAHTGTEIETWLDDWSDRWQAQGAMSLGLSAELEDFAARHQWYFNPSHPPARPSSRQRQRSPNRGMGTNVEQWRDLVAAYFPDPETALCIMAHESGGNPEATNPSSGAAGLFQHLPKYWAERSRAAGWAGADIYDPTANVAVAAWLRIRDGWGHWTPWLRGECRG